MHYEPNWNSLAQIAVPAWYQKARFGIFIHWGIFSVPAFDNEWYSRNMYQQGTVAFNHHRETYGDHTKFGYKDFIPMFKAERFDPAQWAELFREAGARYVVPVAEHHDGFAMYDSALSNWTAAKMGPKRDVLGELSAAVRQAGMTFGLSNHRAEHWWFMNGGMAFPSDVQDEKYRDFYGPAKPGPSFDDPAWHTLDWQPAPDAAYLEDWLQRNIELVDKYRPQLYYFDWWIEQKVFEPYLQRFAAHYYNRAQEWGVEVAINCKNGAFPEGTAVFDVERGQLKEIRPVRWQTDTAILKNSWCYVQNPDYKTDTSILHDLIDIVSKNGNLLLNVGPRADGTIPEEDAAILRELGRWLAINGEAIYESQPWKIYGEGPTAVVEGAFQDTKRAAFTPEDIRFTTKDGALYAILLGTPKENRATIKSLGTAAGLYHTPIKQVSLLGSPAPVTWQQDTEGLHLVFPPVTDKAIVFKIE